MSTASENLADLTFRSAYNSGDVTPAFDLLSSGADPNAVDRHGFSALSRAAQFDCLDLVHALLAAGADVNQSNRWGATPLMAAKSRQVAEALLAAGAAPDAVTIPNSTGLTAGQSALMQAAQMGRLPVVLSLLRCAADPDLRDENDASALVLAALMGYGPVTDALVAGGARVGMEEAAVLGDTAALEALIRAGSDLHRDRTALALWWAAGRGQEAAVVLLLSHGADVDARHQRGKTALMHAVLWGREATVGLLLERGAAVNATDDFGKTALLWSQEWSHGGKVGIVHALLAAGAAVDQASDTGWTPLMAASMRGTTDCAQVLVSHGADVNAVNGIDEDGVGGSTALIYAVMNSRAEMIDLLIRSGADVSAKGLGTRTPLAMARDRRKRPGFDEQIIELLERAGAT